MRRRAFLRGTGWAAAATLGARALSSSAALAQQDGFAAGPVRHLLPSVSSSRLLLTASLFAATPGGPPRLAITGGGVHAGRVTDSDGLHVALDVTGLDADTEHELVLVDASGRAVTDPWPLRTAPAPSSSPSSFRLGVWTCAGGHEDQVDPRGDDDPLEPVPLFQPLSARRRLFRRLLSFAPDAVHANGDHVYWDLRALPNGLLQFTPESLLIAQGVFVRELPVKGTSNERVLKNAFGPQIADLYGTLFRSTPVTFVPDDHDYTDNDAANPLYRTFPADAFMREAAAFTQDLYYPQLFADDGLAAGPAEDELAAAGLARDGLSRQFGTLRYGDLFEAWAYDCVGAMNNTRDPDQPDFNGNRARDGHPGSRMVPADVEDWLVARMRTSEAACLAHLPSTPIMWSAGKFAEWYPDVLGGDGRLTDTEDKPFWPDGWNDQHDRLLAAAAARRDRLPLWLSGDLHQSSLGVITRSREVDLSHNPVHAVGVGTIGTGLPGFPSRFRGTLAQPSVTLEAEQVVAPIEENGFTILDVEPTRTTIRMFRWNHTEQSEEEIDDLQPFHVEVLEHPHAAGAPQPPHAPAAGTLPAAGAGLAAAGLATAGLAAAAAARRGITRADPGPRGNRTGGSPDQG